MEIRGLLIDLPGVLAAPGLVEPSGPVEPSSERELDSVAKESAGFWAASDATFGEEPFVREFADDADLPFNKWTKGPHIPTQCREPTNPCIKATETAAQNPELSMPVMVSRSGASPGGTAGHRILCFYGRIDSFDLRIRMLPHSFRRMLC